MLTYRADMQFLEVYQPTPLIEFRAQGVGEAATKRCHDRTADHDAMNVEHGGQ